MNSRIVLVLAVVLIITLSALLVLELTTGIFSGYRPPAPSRPVGSALPQQQPKPPQSTNELCGTVDSRCTATAFVDVVDCNRATAERQLESLLASPLTRGDCPRAMQRLAARCPAPCTIDPASKRIIAAKIEITPREPGPNGSCRFEGRRLVELSGSCYR